MKLFSRTQAPFECLCQTNGGNSNRINLAELSRASRDVTLDCRKIPRAPRDVILHSGKLSRTPRDVILDGSKKKYLGPRDVLLDGGNIFSRSARFFSEMTANSFLAGPRDDSHPLRPYLKHKGTDS